MKLTLDSTVTLNDGHKMPLLGLGVFQSPSGSMTIDAVKTALKVGYRLIDTARIYGNEKDVGLAIKESGVSREKVFVTTKLWNSDQGYDTAMRAFDESLSRLNCEYIDLYLIHWPLNPKSRLDSWRAMVEIKNSGRCRSIGVSNFTIRHLEGFLEKTDVVPAVNQVEFSPFLFQKDIFMFCRKHKIRLEAYSPLTKGERLDDEMIVSLAKKYNKTGAQIVLRWALQHEIVVIPKSNHAARIKENADLFDFEISDQDMKILDNLDEDFRTSWDPTDIP
jgi:methylglyoxal/glyoxal reductase